MKKAFALPLIIGLMLLTWSSPSLAQQADTTKIDTSKKKKVQKTIPDRENDGVKIIDSADNEGRMPVQKPGGNTQNMPNPYRKKKQ